ncbi:hypothetical protein [Escherichia coli]|uniref:hypothetical protein n=1 Tax=Escherichia coli TaxID=562 RepID=UPI002572E901|nr:hypothetical protein [Escherichia coli]
MLFLLFEVDMRSFYEDWPETFVTRLDMLRALDNRGATRRLYTKRTGAIYNALADEVRDAVAGFNTSELDLGPLYRYYKRGGEGDALADTLIALAPPVCRRVMISPDVYTIPYLFFALLIARGEDDDARDFFNMMMRPLIVAYRFKQLARYLGTKGGGRPQHRLKDEALQIAEVFFTNNPHARVSAAVARINEILVKKYADVPAESTIRKWLTPVYGNEK